MSPQLYGLALILREETDDMHDMATDRFDVLAPEFERIAPPGTEVETINCDVVFGEGPVWNAAEQYLLFSDVSGDVIRRWDASGVGDWRRPSRKSNGLTYDPQGRLVACEHVTSSVTRTEHDGSVTTVASHWQGKELNSPNDVAVRSDGAVYFTDPSDGRTSGKWGLVRPRQIDFHGVYMAPADGGQTVLLVDDFVFPNGPCFSPDERILYVNDTTKMHIRAFDVRPMARSRTAESSSSSRAPTGWRTAFPMV